MIKISKSSSILESLVCVEDNNEHVIYLSVQELIDFYKTAQNQTAPLSYVTNSGVVKIPDFVRESLNIENGGGVFFNTCPDGSIKMLSNQQALASCDVEDEKEKVVEPLAEEERMFPQLHHAIRDLVCKGFYTIFETSDPKYPQILLTKDGIRSIDKTGALLPVFGKDIKDFENNKELVKRIRLNEQLAGPIVRRKNLRTLEKTREISEEDES